MAMAIQQRALIVGAGACGLQFAESVVAAGLDCLVIDDHPAPGGLWQKRVDLRSVLFKTLRSNLPMQGMCLNPVSFKHSECPISELASFPTGEQLSMYLKEFGDGLNKTAPIWKEGRVERVTQNVDRARRWTATVASTTKPPASFGISSLGKDRWRVDADFVAYCGGHFSIDDAEWPNISGLQSVRDAGLALHSGEYTGPAQLRGRRVLVIGGGSSGTDIARDAAATALSCLWARRRSAVHPPREAADLSRPTEVAAVRELRLFTEFPPATAGAVESSEVCVDDTISGVANAQGASASGLSGVRAELADGTTIEVDLVVACTGYVLSPPPIFRFDDGEVSLDQRSVLTGDGLAGAAASGGGGEGCTEGAAVALGGHLKSSRGVPVGTSGDIGASGDASELYGLVPALHSVSSRASAFAKSLEPLSMHLLHSDDPTLCVGGLPMNVMPWPLFREQADFIASLWGGMASGRLEPPDRRDLRQFSAEVDLPASKSLIRRKLGIPLERGKATAHADDGKISVEGMDTCPCSASGDGALRRGAADDLDRSAWHFLGPSQFHYRQMLARMTEVNLAVNMKLKPSSATVAAGPRGAGLVDAWLQAGASFVDAVLSSDSGREASSSTAETKLCIGLSPLPRSAFSSPSILGRIVVLRRVPFLLPTGDIADRVKLPQLADIGLSAAACTADGAIPPSVPKSMRIILHKQKSGRGPALAVARVKSTRDGAGGRRPAASTDLLPRASDGDEIMVNRGTCVAHVPIGQAGSLSPVGRIELDRLVYHLCGAARAAGESYRASQFRHVIGGGDTQDETSDAESMLAGPLPEEAEATSGEPFVECACLGAFQDGAPTQLPYVVVVAPVRVVEAMEQVW